MRGTLREETVIFFGVVKWIFIATIVGSIVGVSTTIFLRSLTWSIHLFSGYSLYYLLIPVGFLASAYVIRRFAPDAEGHGTEKVIEAVHKYSGRIKFAVVPIKLIATLFTIALGGSAGKEGPCAQIGGGLASLFADIFKFSDADRKKVVICGISAGFASVFGTPLSGSIFGVEVLFVGTILYEVLLPSFVAGITSYQISSALGVSYFYHPLNFVPVFSESFFLKMLLAGIIFGIVARIMVEILYAGEWVVRRLKLSWPLNDAIGGVVMILIAVVLGREYLGLGLNTIQSSLEGNFTDWYAFLAKSVTTSLTLNFGGSGGIVTPIFFVGSTAGSLLGRILSLDPGTFAAIGLVAVLAGTTNAPIAASIMAVEMFGPAVAPYSTVACVVSFLMTGHRSVYPSQVLAVKKSPAVSVELGKVLEDLNPEVRFRNRSDLRLRLYLRRLFRKKTKPPNFE
jgi:H+/Cl- antiporter ClcA